MKILLAITAILATIGTGWFGATQTDILGANNVTYSPDIYPITDSTYHLGTTSRAWLTATFDEICLTADDCYTAITGGGGGGGATTTVDIDGVDQGFLETIDFDGSDFDIVESPTNDFDISVADIISFTNASTTWASATTFFGNLVGNVTGNLTGNADTATQLATNGANCSAGSGALGVDASGAAESCTDFEEDLSNSAGLRAALSDEVGTGAAYFVGGALGTPASGNGSNLTALNATQLTSGTVPAARVGASHIDTITEIASGLKDGTGACSSGLLCLGGHTHAIATEISGLASNIATWLGTPSSANLATAVTDEVGSGALVFGTSPTITTPTFATNFTFDSVTVTGLTGIDTGIVTGTAGSNGHCAEWDANGDLISAGAPCGTGGAGGSGLWASTTNDMVIYPVDTNDIVVIGTSSTSSTATINGENDPLLEVDGNAYFSGDIAVEGRHYQGGNFRTYLDWTLNNQLSYLVGSDNLFKMENPTFTGFNMVFNESGEDGTIRFESDTDENLLFLDATSTKIGISTSSPFAKFAIQGTANQTNPVFEVASSSYDSYLSITASGAAQFNGATSTEALNVNGNFQVNDTTASKAYRFRTSGSNLDLDAAGADLYISNYTGAGFTGTQRNYMIMGSEFDFVSAYSVWEWKDRSGGNVQHSIDGEGGITFNEQGVADQDFRVEGDSVTHLLFADASADNVGIGTSSPWAKFSIEAESGQVKPLFNIASSSEDNILTVEADGEIVVGTDNHEILPFEEATFAYATTTWTGTTTIQFGASFTAHEIDQANCFTDTGTLNVVVSDGTNDSGTFGVTATAATDTLTGNNTFTALEERYIEIGTPASSPTKVSCTFKLIHTPS